ncbi:hypothetical protein BC827DRAFT_1251820, partial [Russula dissimulans]
MGPPVIHCSTSSCHRGRLRLFKSQSHDFVHVLCTSKQFEPILRTPGKPHYSVMTQLPASPGASAAQRYVQVAPHLSTNQDPWPALLARASPLSLACALQSVLRILEILLHVFLFAHILEISYTGCGVPSGSGGISHIIGILLHHVGTSPLHRVCR